MLAGVDESGRSHVPAAKSGTNMTVLAPTPERCRSVSPDGPDIPSKQISS